MGETTALVATNPTGDIISWKSSNPEIAIVSSDGVVTPISEGITTITASISGTTVSCIVRVTNPLDTILPSDSDNSSDLPEDSITNEEDGTNVEQEKEENE